ncbi:MAG: Protochlamydia outer rane protein [Parachlamydiales bacterium]|nr:Protochlamydia outer rane protein [Parachlamydiales bacterium]
MVVWQSLFALERTGFGVGMAAGYRQDCVDWRIGSRGRPTSWNHERYPHLRMFDCAAGIDASAAGFHLQGQGDLGWFSDQRMYKRIDEPLMGEFNPAASSQFDFIARGRAASMDWRFGYQFEFDKNQWAFLPFVGWVYNQINIHRNGSIPPFFPMTQNIPAPYAQANESVGFMSGLHQTWRGPMLGAAVGWQIAHRLAIDASYGYGWLKFRQNFAETNQALLYLSGSASPSENISTTIADGRIQSRARCHLARCKIEMNMTAHWLFDFVAQYASYYTLTASCRSMQQRSGGSLEEKVQSAQSHLYSAACSVGLTYRF